MSTMLMGALFALTGCSATETKTQTQECPAENPYMEYVPRADGTGTDLMQVYCTYGDELPQFDSSLTAVSIPPEPYRKYTWVSDYSKYGVNKERDLASVVVSRPTASSGGGYAVSDKPSGTPTRNASGISSADQWRAKTAGGGGDVIANNNDLRRCTATAVALIGGAGARCVQN